MIPIVRHNQTRIARSFFLMMALLSFGCMGQPVSASDITPERVVELTNRERTAAGLPMFEVDADLMKAAEAKASDMAEKSYFAHVSSRGITPWYWIEKNNYHYRHAGENLAIRFMNAEDQARAWMESPKHRENILSGKYRDTGVAVKNVSGDDGQVSILVVQMFGTRMDESAPVAEHTAQKLHDRQAASSVRSSSMATVPQSESMDSWKSGAVNAGVAMLEIAVLLMTMFGVRTLFRCGHGLFEVMRIRNSVV